MIDFLKELFLTGVQVRTGLFDQYVVNTFLMLGIMLLMVFITLLVILLTPLYRSARERGVIDADSWIKLCGVWAVFCGMTFLFGIIIWIYWKALLPLAANWWTYLRPLAAHGTVLVALSCLWLAIHLGVRDDSKAAQRTIP